MCDFASVVNETPEGFDILRRALANPNAPKPVIALGAQDAFEQRFLSRALIHNLLHQIDVSGVGLAKIVLLDRDIH